MKRAKILGFMVAIMIAVVALSAELHRAEVSPSKAQPQLVVVRSGGEIVAEVKVNSGKLKIEAEDLAYRQIPGDGMAYNCSGIGNVELTVGGRSLMTIKGDDITIQPVLSTARKTSR